MSTVWLDKPTGSQDIRHVVDLHARANRDWSAGEVLAITDHHHHEIDGLSAELHPAALSGTKGLCLIIWQLATGWLLMLRRVL